MVAGEGEGANRAFGAEVGVKGCGVAQQELGASLAEQVESGDTRHQTRGILTPSLTCGCGCEHKICLQYV